jgi:signal transduction histidine kinase
VKARRLIAFLLMILLPLGFIGYLGYEMSRSEKARTANQFEGLLTQQLNDIDRVFQDELLTIEQELVEAYRMAEAQPSAVRSPLILEAFEIDTAGELLNPAADSPNAGAQEFLKRTRSIWQSGIQLPSLSESQGALATPLQKESVYGNRSARGAEKTRPSITDSGTGWHAWFYNNDVHLLHWLRLPKGHLIGSELNRPAVLARLIGALPASSSLPDARIVLRSATRRVLHQWGSHTPEDDEAPLLSITLSPPLETWSLDYFSNALPQATGGLPRTVLLNLLGLATTFLVIALWFYRENNRTLREAARRVSFVNQVSHELKTPLTNIRLYTEMAASDLSEDEQDSARSLQVVSEETNRLSRLINNVLTFARAERRNLQLQPRPLAVAETTTACLRHWQPALELAGVQVLITESAPVTVLADRDAFEQILGNLFSNLEKYAPRSGPAHLTIQAQEDHIQLDLVDQGPGIPRHARKRVFAPFTRLHSTLNEGISGTGIGLSIARNLAREMAGDLLLIPSSSGAHFRLILPRAQSPTSS